LGFGHFGSGLGNWDQVEHKGPGQLTLVHTVTSKLPYFSPPNQDEKDGDEDVCGIL